MTNIDGAKTDDYVVYLQSVFRILLYQDLFLFPAGELRHACSMPLTVLPTHLYYKFTQ